MGKRLTTVWGFGMMMVSISAFVELPVQSAASTVTLNVTNFGARGDAFETLADTVQGSAVVHLAPTNNLTLADIGKLMLVFGAGAASTPTNQQDLVAQILLVAQGTNVTLSSTAGITASQMPVTCGTQNALAFQQCVNSCTGTDSVVQIPAGHYLLAPPVMLDPNFVMAGGGDARPAVTLRTGGIHFLGADRASSVLLGCGAWMLKGGWVHRGWMFECLGPVTNDTPLIFESLTFDGGARPGREAYYNSGPARITDGAGWDVTHDAVVDVGAPPLHAFKEFVDCTFTHWRGEMVKSVASLMDGYIEVTNCAFLDGEASGFNFNFTHRITGCTFSNLDMAMEFYAGYMKGESVFENCVITNVRNGIVLVGALTNHAMPSYTISGNTIAPAQTAILLGPARNVTIASNQFSGGAIGIGTDGLAYQGTGENSNIVIVANTFQNTGTPFNVAGAGEDGIIDVLVSSNQAWNCGRFAEGYGWSSNVVFRGNTSSGVRSGFLHSQQLLGQWFADDASNIFPWFSVYDNPPAPDPITYANGMRQRLYPAKTNSVFIIDGTHPELIPPGAALMINNGGKSFCLISTSTNVVGAVPIAAGDIMIYQWQNGSWQWNGNVSAVRPPQNLRINQP